MTVTADFFGVGAKTVWYAVNSKLAQINVKNLLPPEVGRLSGSLLLKMHFSSDWLIGKNQIGDLSKQKNTFDILMHHCFNK